MLLLIFAKILKGEIPCKKVYENDHVLAFHDINPQKKVHVLVIPKGEYVDLDDFNNKASDKEIVELNKAVTHVANLMGSKDKGYRALTNIGSDGGQEVPHLHFHILGGTLSNNNSQNKEDLLINSLVERISRDNIDEVILATSATVEGQTTAFYIQDTLKKTNIKISKLAQGLPVGGEIENLDDGTACRRRLQHFANSV